MNLFGPRKVIDEDARAEAARLGDELARVESVVRQIETEVAGMHDQVRRWMRRAVAAERAVERNQEPHANGFAAVTPASPAAPAAPARLSMRGARARIALRKRFEFEQRSLLPDTPNGALANGLPAADSTLPESHPEPTGG